MYVSQYTYLGQIVLFEDKMEKEIQKRITNAWKKYWSLMHIFKSNVALYIKRKTFDICISPILTNGAQTWALTEKLVRKIRICQNKMERSMLKITWKDKMSIKTMRKQTGIADVTATMNHRMGTTGREKKKRQTVKNMV